MQYVERAIYALAHLLKWVGFCALLALVILACANVVGRALGEPIYGTWEIVSFLGAVISVFALAYTQIQRGHIRLEVVVSRLRQPIRGILAIVAYFVSSVMFALCAWQTGHFATIIWRTGELSETLKIPYYPLVYAVAFGFTTLSVILLIDFLKSFTQLVKK